MARFAIRRLLEMLAVLLAISIVVFLIFNVIPSDPAARIAGKSSTPELIASVERTWGFDDSLPVQYLTTMKLAFTGELVSYSSQLNVVEEIWKGLPATLSLCLGAVAIWILFGALVGYLSAVRAGRLTDWLLTALSLTSVSLPIFLPAAIFLNYLSFELDLFPSGGYVGLTEDPLDWAYHLVLPCATLAIVFIGFYGRVLRSSMLDAMSEDYVRTARAKGLSERRVQVHHVLRNALLPIVGMLGLDFAALVGGNAIITEYIFNLHGVGQLAADGAINLDLPPIMGVTLFAAFFVVVVNTLVDIAYTKLDPRIRLERTAE